MIRFFYSFLLMACCLAHSSNATQYKFGNPVVAPYTVSPQSPNLNQSGVSREDQRVVAGFAPAESASDAQSTRDWSEVIALALPLALLVVVLFKLRRTIEGQAQLKVLDFADSGLDDEDTLRRARLASAFLGNELPAGFVALLNKQKPERLRILFEGAEHRSGLIKMLAEGDLGRRTAIIRYWNACFNDYKPDRRDHWFARLAREAGVDVSTLPDFNKKSD
jgi:hypothetical protein